MLMLTGAAIDAIRTLTTQPGLPADAGLRIVHSDTAGSLSLSVSPGPEAGDELLEASGVRIFLQTDAAVMLDGKSLDAHVDEAGVIFEIGLQP